MGSLPILGWFHLNAIKPESAISEPTVIYFKRCKDIRSNNFISTSKSTTVKVPFHTTGNIGELIFNHGMDVCGVDGSRNRRC